MPQPLDRATSPNRTLLLVVLLLAAGMPGCRNDGGSGESNSATMQIETIEFSFHERANEAELITDPERLTGPGRFETIRKKADGKPFQGGERPALILTPPAQATYSVDVPPDSRLSFAAGIAKHSQPYADEVRFEVLVGDKTIFDRILAPGREPADRDWIPFELDLEGEGQTTFVFRTSFPKERAADALPILCGFGAPHITTSETASRTIASREKPNLLYIVVDTVRADHLGCYGHERNTSPRLDALANEGLRYAAPVSSAPWTWPATASLLTGLPPFTHRVIFADSCYLPSAAHTIAEVLQDSGVTTYAISANPLICRPQNFDQGFEFFEEAFQARAGMLTDHFLSWLDDHESHRFFAYLHYFDPHYPYDPPGGFEYVDAARREPVPQSDHARYDAMRKMKSGEGVKGYLDHEDDADAIRELYDGEIRYFDEQFGRLLDDLQNRGVLDNTIVVVTSDHGEEFFDHGRVGHSIQLHDELLVVPLLLWYPPRIRAGVVDAQVETEWLPATLLDLMGARVPPDAGLVERLPLTPDVTSSEPAYSTTERWRNPDEALRHRQVSIRTKQWKLIVVPEAREESDDGDVREIVEPDLLFDLLEDPEETTNVADRYPDVVKKLRAELDEWIQSTNDRSLKSSDEIAGESTIEKLRKLGYLPDPGEKKDKKKGQEESGPEGADNDSDEDG